MKLEKLMLAVGLISCASVLGQGTTRTVFPYDRATANGDANELVFSGASDRQQWFRSEYLTQVWSTAVLISEISFRLEDRLLPTEMNALVPHIDIYLSTTSVQAENLKGSLVAPWGGDPGHWDWAWAQNSGPDGQRVYAADNVVITAPGGSGPNPFAIRFALDTPFIYDPSVGNLLMRISTHGSGSFTPMGGGKSNRRPF